MNERSENTASALLPAGMSDLLPPDAAFEAHVIDSLISTFADYGYERVKPPLMEFEDSLLRGPGAATANEAFRLMDPVSQRMMALRADMTPQIARIAGSRLANSPRPLRLSYAGQILRVSGTQLRGARQFGQVGAEIIGADERAADAELILMAAEALNRIGIEGLSVDICLPTLVPAVCHDLGIAAGTAADLRAALDRKDAAAIAAMRDDLGDAAADLFGALLAATGDAGTMFERLAALPLGPEAMKQRADLETVLGIVRDNAPDLKVTVDPVEHRGWEYHCGIAFTFFAKGARGELGAGGRYSTGDETSTSSEPATGVTLFTDTLLQALTPKATRDRVYVPHGTPAAAGHRLREEGWVTVQGLAATTDPAGEARRLHCTQILKGDNPQPLD